MPRPSELLLDVLLGFTAGVMLAATAFNLLVPALEEGTLAEVVAGITAGGVALVALDTYVPHIHLRFTEAGHGDEAAPEGLAVGVAFAAGGTDLGVPIAVAIGIQNIPEGFAAAAPLLAGGGSRRRGAAVAAATGSVEPPAALLALATFGVASVLLPFGLAFAAGAMLYVVVDEQVPESHARGGARTVGCAPGRLRPHACARQRLRLIEG